MKNVSVIKLLVVSFFCISIVFASPLKSFAGEPTEQVKQTVDAVINILNNKELKKPGKTKERRAAIRKIIDERFNWEEMSKRSLAQNWKNRTPDEKKEFVPLYSDLLESTYIKKIERYENEKVVYAGEKIDGPYASVKTNIVSKNEVEIPVEYRLLRNDGKWEVYDVIVEGVSLVNNYRTQFNSIIRSNSYEELVKRLKNKALKEPSKD